MAKCCGPKALTKKLIIGDQEIPVKGLEPVMFMVLNMNLNEETKIIEVLRNKIIELGNSIPANKENEFNEALLEEYKKFKDKIKIKRETR